MNIETEAVRGYIYRVAFAVILVFGLYGIVTAEQADVWREAVQLVLFASPPALAAKNTSVKP